MPHQLGCNHSRRCSLAWPAAVALVYGAGGPAACAEQAPGVSASGGAVENEAGSALQPFLDNDYQLQFPSSYTYIETPIPQVERGPQPERSPLRARFESSDGSENVSVVVRKAAALKPTLFQLTDISQFGDALEVAKLLLPRGSTLLAARAVREALTSKETPLGTVQLPPRTYYVYDFTTPGELRVAMAAAAQKGSVYVCGASAPAARWPSASGRLAATVASFRLRDGGGAGGR